MKIPFRNRFSSAQSQRNHISASSGAAEMAADSGEIFGGLNSLFLVSERAFIQQSETWLRKGTDRASPAAY